MRRPRGEEVQGAEKRGNPYAAFVFEPLIQGAAGMVRNLVVGSDK